jgi:hypothetical protein
MRVGVLIDNNPTTCVNVYLHSLAVAVNQVNNKQCTFAFPRDIDRRTLWKVKIGRKSRKASDGGRILKVITFPL